MDYEEFERQIKPYTDNIEQIAKNQLLFFKLLDKNKMVEMNDNVIENYELFIRIYHQQNQILNVIPSLEVQ